MLWPGQVLEESRLARNKESSGYGKCASAARSRFIYRVFLFFLPFVGCGARWVGSENVVCVVSFIAGAQANSIHHDRESAFGSDKMEEKGRRCSLHIGFSTRLIPSSSLSLSRCFFFFVERGERGGGEKKKGQGPGGRQAPPRVKRGGGGRKKGRPGGGGEEEKKGDKREKRSATFSPPPPLFISLWLIFIERS